jgi:hypothetical protein
MIGWGYIIVVWLYMHSEFHSMVLLRHERGRASRPFVIGQRNHRLVEAGRSRKARYTKADDDEGL